MQRWFLSRYPPWQNEQLAAVYEYLENSFAQGEYPQLSAFVGGQQGLSDPLFTDSLEVFKHDVDFGEVGIDYLTTGADNGFRQDWVSDEIHLEHEAIMTVLTSRFF